MAYVEWHDTVRNHPKTDALMLALKIRRREAVGIVGCISSWAIQYRPGGRIEARHVGVAVEWEGANVDLVAALVEVGWLDRIDDDWVQIHDWKDITRGYKKAKNDATRKKREYRRILRGDSAEKKRGSVEISRAAPRSDLNRSDLKGAERNREKSVRTMEPFTADPDLADLPLYAADPKLNAAWPTFKAAQIQACPGIDILAETRKAHAWEVANPSRQKRNRTAFLARWFSRQQDRGGSAASPGDVMGHLSRAFGG